MARASRSALKLRLCGFFGVAGASLTSAFDVSLAGADLATGTLSTLGATFSSLGVGVALGAGLLSALAVPPFKLEVIRLASALQLMRNGSSQKDQVLELLQQQPCFLHQTSFAIFI